MKKEYSIIDNFNVNGLIDFLISYLQIEKRMETNIFNDSENQWIIQGKESRNWKKNIGMDKALTIKMSRENNILYVEIGEGKWVDKTKLTGAAISLFLFWPAIIPVALGTAGQTMVFKDAIKKIDEYIYNAISSNTVNTNAKYCSFCGVAIESGSNFCPLCGKKLN